MAKDMNFIKNVLLSQKEYNEEVGKQILRIQSLIDSHKAIENPMGIKVSNEIYQIEDSNFVGNNSTQTYLKLRKEELEKEIVDEYQNLQSMLDEFGVAQEVSNGNKNIQ